MSISVTVTGETTISLTVSPETAVSVLASGGIGPAGFLTAPGTSTNAFGTFQVQAGPGVTISTTSGVFQIASYSTTEAASFAPVQSVAGRTGAVVLQAADITTGTLDIARIPTISYTALSNVPASFAPSAHTHGTADVVGLTAAAASAAPVQSVNGLTGDVTIARADLTAAAEVHTHSTADIISFTASAAAAAPVQSVAGRTGTISLAAADVSGLAAVATSGSYTSLSEIPVEFTPATHTHDAGDVVSGTLDVARIPTLSYTALSNVPTTFAPEAHTHSTNDVVSFTAAASAAAPVQNIVAGSNVTVSTSTSGIYTIAAAGGVTATGTDLGSAAPLPLGVATAGTATAASREDHVHDLPTISYTALSDVPLSFAPDTSVANVVSVNGQTGVVTITLGDALPAQGGNDTRVLTTDGTNASWATRYSVVDPVVVAGAGISISRDTSAGQVTIGSQVGISGTTAALVFTQSPASDQNDYAVSGDIIRLNPSANVTLTGIASGEDGVVKLLYNVGTHVVTLSTGNTNSAETNRFAIVSGDVELSEGDSASVWYDGTSQRWRTLEDQVAGASGGSGGGIAMAYLFGG